MPPEYVLHPRLFTESREVRIEKTLELKIDEKKIPYRSAYVKSLSKSKKRKRDEIESYREKALEELIPHYSERLYLTLAASEELGFSNLIELKQHTSLSGIKALTDEAEKFLHDTEYVSREMLEWLFMKDMELPLKDASEGDLNFLLSSFELKAGFPKKDYTVPAARVLDDSGLVNSSAVNAESGKRAGKAPGSFLFLTSPPAEMAVSIFPEGGPGDYENYLSALGGALSFVFTDQDESFEHRFLRDPVNTELFSELFKGLVYEPTWHERYIDFERSEDFFKLLNLRRLMQARFAAGRAVYEAALYSGESEENLKAMYKEVMEKALHTQVSEGDYLLEPDIRKPMQSIAKLRSLMMEPYLSKYLKERYDEEWWRVGDAGSELKGIWSRGGRESSADIASLVGFNNASDELRSVFERELG